MMARSLSLLPLAVLLASIAIIAGAGSSSARSNVVVRVVNKTGQRLADWKNVGEAADATRAERRTMVRSILDNMRRISQADILEELRRRGILHKSFWINNSIFIPDASDELIAELKSRPDVLDVHEEHIAHLFPIDAEEQAPQTFNDDRSKRDLEWNLDHIGVPQAWNITQGAGVLVANIDTGVRYTHNAIHPAYRGSNGDHNYNWWDPEREHAAEPDDENGHGTHTVGTMVGSEESGIGVAPAARWISCKGCRIEIIATCPESDLVECSEFVMCPWDLNGNNPNCDLGADVVSNSWGAGEEDPWFYPNMEAWRAAGTIPVFALGNYGTNCESTSSPGDYDNVMGVGGTDRSDTLGRYSSRGPASGEDGIAELKPDFVAPGSRITSSYNGGDDNYRTGSGTSFASPHIAGVVALMMSANPRLGYDEFYDILSRTSFQDCGNPAGLDRCDGVHFGDYPNYHYGYGRVDAEQAVNAAVNAIY